MTGRSPMQVAVATSPVAARNVSWQGRMFMRRDRSKVMLPVQPESGWARRHSAASALTSVFLTVCAMDSAEVIWAAPPPTLAALGALVPRGRSCAESPVCTKPETREPCGIHRPEC